MCLKKATTAGWVANSADPEKILHSVCLIWVYSICSACLSQYMYLGLYDFSFHKKESISYLAIAFVLITH